VRIAAAYRVAAMVVAVDQLSKIWALQQLIGRGVQPLLPGLLQLQLVFNTGAAFSMFAGRSAAFRIPFFTAITAVAGAAIVGFVRRTPASRRIVLLSCAAVLGGAIGNLIDRLRHGEVIDFLSVHWQGHFWPAFNVADSFITVGVLVLLGRALMGHDDLG